MDDDSLELRTVLYAEDNDINVLLMQALFQRRPDLRLQVATTCVEALGMAGLVYPALLLLDLQLPDGHGCNLLPQLRALPGLARVRAVAVTTEALPRHTRHGFDDLWNKPLQLSHVLARLDHWLPRHRMRAPGPVPPAPVPHPGSRWKADTDPPMLAMAQHGMAATVVHNGL